MQNENNARKREHTKHFSFLLLADENNPESKLNGISTLASAIVHTHMRVCVGVGRFRRFGIAKVTNVAIMCILCVRTCRCGSRFSSRL